MKVRFVGTIRDMIDAVPVSYSKIILRCGRREIITRIYHVVRDEEMNPIYVLFDDSCLECYIPPDGETQRSVQFKMNLNLKVFFNKWETDEGTFFVGNNYNNTFTIVNINN